MQHGMAARRQGPAQLDLKWMAGVIVDDDPHRVRPPNICNAAI
jgi:hypothetical protein